MDIGRVLKDSWGIFTRDWGVLVLGALLTGILTVVTLGILCLPLCAGLYLMMLGRVRQGRKPEVRDLFACLDRTGAYLLAYLLFVGIALAFVAVVGTPVALLRDPFGTFLTLLAAFGAAIVAAYLETVWIYWLLVMADRRVGVVDALRESRGMVSRSGFWVTFLTIIVVGAIGGAVNGLLGSVTFGVGSIVAYVLVTPWQFAAYSSMYLQTTGEGAFLPSSFPGPMAAWQGGVMYAWSFPSWPPAAAPGWSPYAPSSPAPPYGPPPGAPPYAAPPYGPSPYGPQPAATSYAPAAAPPYGPPPGPAPQPSLYGPPYAPAAAPPYGPPSHTAAPRTPPAGPPPQQAQPGVDGVPPWSRSQPPSPPEPPQPPVPPA